MSTIKPTEAGLSKKIHRLSELKAKRDEIIDLAAGKDTLFWRGLKKRLQESIKTCEGQIDNCLSSDEMNPEYWMNISKKYFGSKIQAQAIIDLVENQQYILDGIQTQIATLQEEIEEIRSSQILETTEKGV